MVPTDWLAVLPALHATEQLFVILSQARSGTSWLNGMLNSHPDIFADEEIFASAQSAGLVARRNGLQCAFCQSHLRHLGAQSTDPALRGASKWRATVIPEASSQHEPPYPTVRIRLQAAQWSSRHRTISRLGQIRLLARQRATHEHL